MEMVQILKSQDSAQIRIKVAHCPENEKQRFTFLKSSAPNLRASLLQVAVRIKSDHQSRAFEVEIVFLSVLDSRTLLRLDTCNHFARFSLDSNFLFTFHFSFSLSIAVFKLFTMFDVCPQNAAIQLFRGAPS